MSALRWDNGTAVEMRFEAGPQCFGTMASAGRGGAQLDLLCMDLIAAQRPTTGGRTNEFALQSNENLYSPFSFHPRRFRQRTSGICGGGAAEAVVSGRGRYL